MHRERQTLQYFHEFGWRPRVIAVDPMHVEGRAEPLLLQSFSDDIDVTRVRALPVKLTRKVGLGDIALRSMPFLYRAGARIIRENKIDLVYFSTTAFPAVALGRIWKERFGVPFVVDMQDPWLSDYYKDKPASAKPPKYWFSQRLHGVLEPWTMKKADGLVSVSRDYLITLRQRYPWLAEKPQAILPFGASDSDFEVVRRHPQPNRFFNKGAGGFNGVYVGRGGKDMEFALQIIFRALRLGLETQPDLFSKVKLLFVGTDYAAGGNARKTAAPVAQVIGVSGYVVESPERVPYFEALQLLLDADFLIVPGSDDPQYTASKIYPYILARKPLLAAFNQRSSVCDVLRETRAGKLLPFDVNSSPVDYVSPFMALWAEILRKLPFTPEVNWDAFAPYTAYEMTRAQCDLFDRVVSVASTKSTIPAQDPLTPVRSEETCSN
jgi:hypothetical protein